MNTNFDFDDDDINGDDINEGTSYVSDNDIAYDTWVEQNLKDSFDIRFKQFLIDYNKRNSNDKSI